MNSDLINTILLAFTVAGGAIYGITKIFNGSGKATKEQVEIYEGLNKALKEEVSVLKEKMDQALIDLKQLKVEITQVTTDKTTLENLIIRALREFFSNNPDVANRLKQSKKFKELKVEV